MAKDQDPLIGEVLAEVYFQFPYPKYHPENNQPIAFVAEVTCHPNKGDFFNSSGPTIKAENSTDAGSKLAVEFDRLHEGCPNPKHYVLRAVKKSVLG